MKGKQARIIMSPPSIRKRVENMIIMITTIIFSYPDSWTLDRVIVAALRLTTVTVVIINLQSLEDTQVGYICICRGEG